MQLDMLVIMSQALQKYVQMVVLLCALHVQYTAKYFALLHEVHLFPADARKIKDDNQN